MKKISLEYFSKLKDLEHRLDTASHENSASANLINKVFLLE